MVTDGVLKMFDDIALDCKDFQSDEIYACASGKEIANAHGKYVTSSVEENALLAGQT